MKDLAIMSDEPVGDGTLGALIDHINRENDKLYTNLNIKHGAAFFRERPPPIEWLIEGMLEKKNVVMLAGAPKSAKSWLALEIGLSVASGTPLFGDPLMMGTGRSGKVLFCFLEDGPHNIHARCTALAKGKGIREVEKLDLFFRFGGGINMGVRSQAIQLGEAIKAGIPDLDLLVFDPFRNLHYGDENDSSIIIQIMDNLRYLRDNTGASVLVTHHTRKPGGADKNNPGFAIRGSGAIFGSVDGLISMVSIEDLDQDEDTITNNVFTRVKAGKEARPFSVTLSIKDGFDGRAERATWNVAGKI